MKFYAAMVLLLLVCLAADSKPLEGVVSNNKGGIGIRTDWDHKVTRVYLDSPAEKAGIEVGDKILLVDGKKHGTTRGTPHTVANVVVQRGDGLMEFNVERVPAVEIKRKWIRY